MKINNILENNYILKNKTKKIHFIGIGGIGISGIAKIFIKKGYNISGSDIIKNKIIYDLHKLGIQIYIGHNKRNVINSNLIIKSSVIDNFNVEIQEAIKLNIPILNRGDILHQLTKKYYCISISGTHGKTTITSIIIFIFVSYNLDPTFLNGGKIINLNKSCNLGKSKYFIIEADESDLTFLRLNSNIIIVSNIDKDHLGSYKNDFCELKKSFIKALNKIPNSGLSILCIDDLAIKEIIPYLKCKIITYGFDLKSDVIITNYKQNNFYSSFKLKSIKYKLLNFKVNLNTIPGKHNALNVTASIILSNNKNIKIDFIKKSLVKFKGIYRRFELLNINLKKLNLNDKDLIFISDYGHHPNEIYENIKTIRSGWSKYRLIMIFQPHRFSRTRDLFYDFVEILLKVDYLLILDIFPFFERPIKNINSRKIFEKIKFYNKKFNVIYIKNINNIKYILLKILLNKDLILIQGAGNIHDIIINILN